MTEERPGGPVPSDPSDEVVEAYMRARKDSPKGVLTTWTREDYAAGWRAHAEAAAVRGPALPLADLPPVFDDGMYPSPSAGGPALPADPRLDEIRGRRAAIGPEHWYWWMSDGPPFAIGAGSNAGIGVTTSSGPLAEFVASAPADIDYLLSLLSGQAARDRETRFAAGSLSGAPNADIVADSAGTEEPGVGSGPSAPSVNDVRLEMLREVMAALGWDDYARPQTPESLWRECLAEIRADRSAR